MILAGQYAFNVEVQSKEEFLRNIKEINKSLRVVDPEEVAIGSMDFTALYPSLDQKTSARMAKEAYLESEFEVESIDWKAASLYLALTVSRQELVKEGISHLVARRKQGRGRKPTVRCSKMSGPMTREERSDLEREVIEDVE